MGCGCCCCCYCCFVFQFRQIFILFSFFFAFFSFSFSAGQCFRYKLYQLNKFPYCKHNFSLRPLVIFCYIGILLYCKIIARKNVVFFGFCFQIPKYMKVHSHLFVLVCFFLCYVLGVTYWESIAGSEMVLPPLCSNVPMCSHNDRVGGLGARGGRGGKAAKHQQPGTAPMSHRGPWPTHTCAVSRLCRSQQHKWGQLRIRLNLPFLSFEWLSLSPNFSLLTPFRAHCQ